MQLVRHGCGEDGLSFVPHDGRREVAVRRVPWVGDVLEAHALGHQVVPGAHRVWVGEELGGVVWGEGLIDVELGDLGRNYCLLATLNSMSKPFHACIAYVLLSMHAKRGVTYYEVPIP